MIEVIFVMVIMAILAAMAVPRLMRSDADERALTERLRSTLRYVQRMSIARNRDVCVAGTATTVTFRVATAAGTAVPCGITPQASLGDGELLDIVLPAGSPLNFLPPFAFRFTPAGVLTDNAGVVSNVVSSIAVRRGLVTYATLGIQPANGFVLATAF